ncbi:CsxC family protein [Bacillus sp. T33-2]|uniref:CsxC family protein n=1 Tax=Bacillus sp. T33-2 TaxID=2054168 RepID=UPI000C769649|nr:hypothetical protein [Bacillus sp. T33-2]PLR97522.1 hypothetical protein CVD19_08535 [Bacillus sp. T33-2]
MKKNTCGCNDKHGCPDLPSCDKADTKHVDCFHDEFPPKFFADKVPVIDVAVPLSEVCLEADVEAKIHLPTPAREIKHIRKNVSLKQCKVIPSTLHPKHFVKVFITGVVHKNIQYVEHCSGVLKDHSVDVHFNCHRTIKLFSPVQFPVDDMEFSIKNTVLERRELDKDGHGADRCSSGSLTFELFNEPIECKLIAAAVKEIDILKNFDTWGRFDTIIEKMEVLMLFKIWQKQQVKKVGFHHYPPHGYEGGEHEGHDDYDDDHGPSARDIFKGALKKY